MEDLRRILGRPPRPATPEPPREPKLTAQERTLLDEALLAAPPDAEASANTNRYTRTRRFRA
jgi:hypothetical protein